MRRAIAVLLIIAVGLAVGGTYVITPASRPDVIRTACPSDDLRQAQTVIVEQTRAMSAQDFVTARGYASQAFQNAVTLEQFADIISNDYTYLLQNPQITFNDCAVIDAAGLLVSASFVVDGTTHVVDYALVDEQGGWYINVAASQESQTLAV
jgi:Domain of unknown function (DUF4864)